TSWPGPTPSAMSATSSASVPDDTPTACLTASAAVRSRSSPSTSGPRMNWPWSTTRAAAARRASRSGPFWAPRSNKGTRMRLGYPGERPIVGRFARASQPRAEVLDRAQEALLHRHAGGPAEELPRARDVRLAAGRVVLRQRLVEDRARRAGEP